MELVTKSKKPRLDLCIICQKKFRTEKLTSTQYGRSRKMIFWKTFKTRILTVYDKNT